MNIKVSVFLLAIVILLSGCSTISKTDCLATDWTQAGLEDGQRGISASAAGSYQENCSKLDVEMDMTAYNQGHETGVALFCQAENAFELGEEGYQYSVDCPTAFNDEYKVGYQFYSAYYNISQVEKTITANTTSIGQLQSRISSATLQLSDDDLSTAEENAIRQNIESMESQIEGYEQNNQILVPALQQVQQQFKTLKAQSGR